MDGGGRGGVGGRISALLQCIDVSLVFLGALHITFLHQELETMSGFVKFGGQRNVH